VYTISIVDNKHGGTVVQHLHHWKVIL